MNKKKYNCWAYKRDVLGGSAKTTEYIGLCNQRHGILIGFGICAYYVCY